MVGIMTSILRLPAFDRWDYLGTRVLLIASAVATLVVTVLLPVVEWARGRPLVSTVLVDGDPPAVTDPPLLAGAEATWDRAATVSLGDASTGAWLASLLPGVVLSVAVLLVVAGLVRLVAGIQRDGGLSDGSVTTLRVVAVTVIAAPWALSLAAGIAEDRVRTEAFGGSGATVSFEVTGAMLALTVLGLVIAALAEAFRRGASLEHDVDGLV